MLVLPIEPSKRSLGYTNEDAGQAFATFDYLAKLRYRVDQV